MHRPECVCIAGLCADISTRDVAGGLEQHISSQGIYNLGIFSSGSGGPSAPIYHSERSLKIDAFRWIQSTPRIKT